MSLRHEIEDDFRSRKNHESLWYGIVQNMEKLGFQVTVQQAKDKYFNLKKKWKEVIDGKTGTERVDFRHQSSFDLTFGTKASTKPAFVVDIVKSKILLLNSSKDESYLDKINSTHNVKIKKQCRGKSLVSINTNEYKNPTKNPFSNHLLSISAICLIKEVLGTAHQ